ncbi:hypothetical protein BDP81DRAFT_434950 [Colletotrichum phormii]|uniref:Uncharacterized protein n=1 Tax=Colletotrichum phormii TaxID=359342 RepID=A0AAI9ZK98_9PEZI|nr:uncharacterized protein BDP81DRAFT_434950 [Colletotrichum phormii]KAK1633469.1 hypothetical protein BDP81DRAFT_434950 [Colletotrichum phormii]
MSGHCSTMWDAQHLNFYLSRWVLDMSIRNASNPANIPSLSTSFSLRPSLHPHCSPAPPLL